jgi:hypothetical protein
MSLQEMKDIDICTVDPATLVDISTVNADMDLPVPERMRDMVRQSGGNPYFFKCRSKNNDGFIAVNVSFADTTTTINDLMESYMRTL